MYTPDFNCFVRRLSSLCEKLPDIYFDGNGGVDMKILRVKEVFGEGFVVFTNGWEWPVGHGSGTFKVNVRRKIKGVYLHEVDAGNEETWELPDYW